MEAEQLCIDHREFKLKDLLKSLVNLLSSDVAKQNIGFKVEVVAALANRPLLGDAQRLRQILLNLAGNAIKFTPAGRVCISVRSEAELASGPMIRFDIRDSGIGIAPIDQERLFQAFAQVDETMTRTYGGTGLGLVICKHLVDLMGGKIGVESTLGHGCAGLISPDT